LPLPVWPTWRGERERAEWGGRREGREGRREGRVEEGEEEASGLATNRWCLPPQMRRREGGREGGEGRYMHTYQCSGGAGGYSERYVLQPGGGRLLRIVEGDIAELEGEALGGVGDRGGRGQGTG